MNRIEFGEIPEISLEKGDKIHVTNEKSTLYNENVEFVREGKESGGIWVKRPGTPDEEEFYLPWGFKKI